MNIQKTRNYSQFKLYPSNRPLVIHKLKVAIKKENMLSTHPIVIGERNYVIDGQHRLKVAEELGLEIYYIVDERLNEEHLPKCQTQRVWTLNDWLNFYKGHRNDYRKLDVICKKFPKCAVFMVTYFGATDNPSGPEGFRQGKFKFPINEQKVHKSVADFEICLEEVNNIIGRGTVNATFKRSFFKFVRQDFFCVDKMLRKMHLNPSYIKDAYRFSKEEHITEVLKRMYSLSDRKKD